MGSDTLVNIGEQRFDRLIEQHKFYIDKTGFIKEWWETGSTVSLITRPRRFGKTLNMSMIECFFSNKYAGRGSLFEGLSIWKDEKYRGLQGTYPVIFMSFAGIRADSVEGMKTAVRQVIANVYGRYRDIMESDIFDENSRTYFNLVNDEMKDEVVLISINRLCIFLQKYYNKDVIVILDEYDTPMQEAWLSGYWDDAVVFFRSFFDNTFKTNCQLDSDDNAVWSLLVATGYLRILKLDRVGIRKKKVYTLALTNMETADMFEDMVKGWFRGGTGVACNEFIKAMLNDNVRMMNVFMNKVALNTFSFFDSGNRFSENAEPERFYHGFVLGMVVNLADRYKIRSNRESGFGRYDVMMEPHDRKGKAFIFEFKVLNPYEDEKTLEETLVNAHAQIEEMRYEAELISEGFASEQIRKYGFAFQGKTCLIG